MQGFCRNSYHIWEKRESPSSGSWTLAVGKHLRRKATESDPAGRMRTSMLPLYEDPGFTFRFAEDRIIPRFHLDGVEPGRRVVVHKIDPVTS